MEVLRRQAQRARAALDERRDLELGHAAARDLRRERAAGAEGQRGRARERVRTRRCGPHLELDRLALHDLEADEGHCTRCVEEGEG